MNTKHTPEPWNTVSDANLGTLIRQEGLIIAKMRELEHLGIDHKANAARIVECVNACKNLDSHQLEDLSKAIDEGTMAIFERTELMRERDELLGVLKQLVHAVKHRTSVGNDIIHEVVEADKTLAKFTTSHP